MPGYDVSDLAVLFIAEALRRPEPRRVRRHVSDRSDVRRCACEFLHDNCGGRHIPVHAAVRTYGANTYCYTERSHGLWMGALGAPDSEHKQYII